MKKLISIFALLTGIAFGQAPQIALTGNVGTGGVFPLINSPLVVFTSDANHTMVYPEMSGSGGLLLVNSSVPLTATRQLIAPVVKGFVFNVENATTGGQSITIIGATGTGITIPNGSMISVVCDGVNYVATVAGVTSFNTRTGAVTLSAADVNSVGALTLPNGTTAPTQSPGDTSTKVANDAFVAAAVAGAAGNYVQTAPSGSQTVTQPAVSSVQSTLNINSLNELLNPKVFSGANPSAQFLATVNAAKESARGGGIVVAPPSFSGTATRLIDGTQAALCADYDNTVTGPQWPGQSLPFAFGQLTLSDCSNTIWLNSSYYPYRAKLLVGDDFDFNSYAFNLPEPAAGELVWHMVRGTPLGNGPIDDLTLSGPWMRQGFNAGVGPSYTTSVEAQPTLQGINQDKTETCVTASCIGGHVELWQNSSLVANFIANGNPDQMDIGLGNTNEVWAQSLGNAPGRYVQFLTYSYSGGTLTVTGTANDYAAGSPVQIFAASGDPLYPLNGQTFSVLGTGLTASQFEITESTVTGSGSTNANTGGIGHTSSGTKWHVPKFVGVRADPPTIDSTFMFSSGQATFTNGSPNGTTYRSWCDQVAFTAYSVSGSTLILTGTNSYVAGDHIVLAVPNTDPLFPMSGLPLIALSTGLSGTQVEVSITAATGGTNPISGSGSTVAKANAGNGDCFNYFAMPTLPLMVCPTAGIDCGGIGGTIYYVLPGSTVATQSVVFSTNFAGSTGIYYWYFFGEKLAIEACCSIHLAATGGEATPMLDPRGGGGIMLDTSLSPPATNPDPQTSEIWLRNASGSALNADATYPRVGLLVNNSAGLQFEQPCTTHFTGSIASVGGVPTLTVTAIATTSDECPGGPLVLSQSIGPDNAIWGAERYGVLASQLTGTGGTGTYTLSQNVGTVASTSMRAYGRTSFMKITPPSTPMGSNATLVLNGGVNAQNAPSTFGSTTVGSLSSSGEIQTTGTVQAGALAATSTFSFASATGVLVATAGAVGSLPKNGSGAGIVTGPTSSTDGDCPSFSGTNGQIQDSGSPCGSGAINPTSVGLANQGPAAFTAVNATSISATGTITADGFTGTAQSGQSAAVLVPADDTSELKEIYGTNHANSAYKWWINNDGSASYPAVAVGGGANTVYICSGGTFAGFMTTSSTGCTGGTATATHLTIQ